MGPEGLAAVGKLLDREDLPAEVRMLAAKALRSFTINGADTAQFANQTAALLSQIHAGNDEELQNIAESLLSMGDAGAKAAADLLRNDNVDVDLDFLI